MLEDFVALKVLGKGTFGKVYLTMCKQTKTFHAMKSIRKDAVIMHNNFEKVQLEKLILL